MTEAPGGNPLQYILAAMQEEVGRLGAEKIMARAELLSIRAEIAEQQKGKRAPAAPEAVASDA